jgi:hypothetical protein
MDWLFVLFWIVLIIIGFCLFIIVGGAIWFLFLFFAWAGPQGQNNHDRREK